RGFQEIAAIERVEHGRLRVSHEQSGCASDDTADVRVRPVWGRFIAALGLRRSRLRFDGDSPDGITTQDGERVAGIRKAGMNPRTPKGWRRAAVSSRIAAWH